MSGTDINNGDAVCLRCFNVIQVFIYILTMKNKNKVLLPKRICNIYKPIIHDFSAESVKIFKTVLLKCSLLV